MKKSLLFFFGWVLTLTCSAQSAQIRLYLQQIAANQVTIELEQAARLIADIGLTFIGKSREGEFGLHLSYFQSLLSVRPSLRVSATAGTATELVDRIAQDCATFYRIAVTRKVFDDQELELTKATLIKIKMAAAEQAGYLTDLVTEQQFSFTDNERLDRLLAVKQQLVALYNFCRFQGTGILQLAEQRRRSAE